MKQLSSGIEAGTYLTVVVLQFDHRAVQLAMEHSTILKALRLTLLIHLG